jgi:hypothetical protein
MYATAGNAVVLMSPDIMSLAQSLAMNAEEALKFDVIPAVVMEEILIGRPASISNVAFVREANVYSVGSAAVAQVCFVQNAMERVSSVLMLAADRSDARRKFAGLVLRRENSSTCGFETIGCSPKIGKLILALHNVLSKKRFWIILISDHGLYEPQSMLQR